MLLRAAGAGSPPRAVPRRPRPTASRRRARRYDDPAVKQFKLNAERNNGRAAMMGILGVMVHNVVGVDSLFPIVK